MPKRLVADIEPGQTDQRGKPISEVFSKVSGLFAVFLADDEVTIQYADDDAMGAEQRKALSPIRPLRGEIDGLVRKLMVALAPPDSADAEERRFYDRQIADALFMGLQGDTDLCRVQLEGVRTQLRERLMSLGRMQVAKYTLESTVYVFVAFCVIVLALWLISSALVGSGGSASAAEGTGGPPPGKGVIDFVTETYLWAAAVFGALGAWLSIAIGLRHREVEPSTNKLDNIVDPTLRIIVAVLSATVLFSLVHLGAFSVKFGTTEIAWTDSTKGWNTIHVAIILGVLAGFSERLVGNLLAKGELAERRAAAATQASANTASGERNPSGRAGAEAVEGGATAAQMAAAAVAATTASAAAAAEEAEDHSLDSQPALDGEEMPDEELPPASGGVAADDDIAEGQR